MSLFETRHAAAPSTQGGMGLLRGPAGLGWPQLDELLRGPHRLPRWIGWRLRLLVCTALLGSTSVFLLAHWLAGQPRLPLTLKAMPDGTVQLQSADDPTLQRLEGHQLLSLHVTLPDKAAGGKALSVDLPVNMLALQRSGRWISDPAERQRLVAFHRRADALLAHWPPQGRPDAGLNVQLAWADAPPETILVVRRGWLALGPLFWGLAGLALAVFSMGAVVVLAVPQWRNLAYAVLAWCQSGQLMLMAAETSLDLFAPSWFVAIDTPCRLALGLISAAAMVQVAVLHPRKLAGWSFYTALAWLAALGLWLVAGLLDDQQGWFLLHLGSASLALASSVLMSLAYRTSPHPFTLVMRRFTVVTLATWVLMALAISHGLSRPDRQLQLTIFGVMTWHVFVALQLLLSPYLSRSRPILQEFSLLAASSTVAASLDLLFVAAFSLGRFASMTLSLSLALGTYLLIRRWLMTRLPGKDALTMELLFQRLYRIAREVDRQPDTLNTSLMRLMRELFDPLETALVAGEASGATLRGNGSVLLVALPDARCQRGRPRLVLVLKHAHKGRRLFTSSDASLAERIIEQLQRALSFDEAVEQGRSEERLRIAQDLHDDIGARLLTLMYQAPNADIEEYIRHTLQDLKTLTRGLAAQSHGLAEAAGEWKRDLSQRLSVVSCELHWEMKVDTDLSLSMVQWSALTRILRELVSNAISHAKAKHVSVSLTLQDDQLRLSVQDDGVGHAPETWAHGLGLGGVRKRVKQLNGQVSWVEAEPRGIRCEVIVAQFSGGQQPAVGTVQAQASH